MTGSFEAPVSPSSSSLAQLDEEVAAFRLESQAVLSAGSPRVSTFGAQDDEDHEPAGELDELEHELDLLESVNAALYNAVMSTKVMSARKVPSFHRRVLPGGNLRLHSEDKTSQGPESSQQLEANLDASTRRLRLKVAELEVHKAQLAARGKEERRSRRHRHHHSRSRADGTTDPADTVSAVAAAAVADPSPTGGSASTRSVPTAHTRDAATAAAAVSARTGSWHHRSKERAAPAGISPLDGNSVSDPAARSAAEHLMRDAAAGRGDGGQRDRASSRVHSRDGNGHPAAATVLPEKTNRAVADLAAPTRPTQRQEERQEERRGAIRRVFLWRWRLAAAALRHLREEEKRAASAASALAAAADARQAARAAALRFLGRVLRLVARRRCAAALRTLAVTAREKRTQEQLQQRLAAASVRQTTDRMSAGLRMVASVVHRLQEAALASAFAALRRPAIAAASRRDAAVALARAFLRLLRDRRRRRFGQWRTAVLQCRAADRERAWASSSASASASASAAAATIEVAAGAATTLALQADLDRASARSAAAEEESPALLQEADSLRGAVA
ncbi:unnamed protein product, partial [Phaeothamnion confervicola]